MNKDCQTPAEHDKASEPKESSKTSCKHCGAWGNMPHNYLHHPVEAPQPEPEKLFMVNGTNELEFHNGTKLTVDPDAAPTEPDQITPDADEHMAWFNMGVRAERLKQRKAAEPDVNKTADTVDIASVDVNKAEPEHPDELTQILEQLDKHIVNGIVISVAKGEDFDTDPILDAHKAAILAWHNKEIEETKYLTTRQVLTELHDRGAFEPLTYIESLKHIEQEREQRTRKEQ